MVEPNVLIRNAWFPMIIVHIVMERSKAIKIILALQTIFLKSSFSSRSNLRSIFFKTRMRQNKGTRYSTKLTAKKKIKKQMIKTIKINNLSHDTAKKAMESVITKYYKSCIKKGKRSILFISQTKKDIKIGNKKKWFKKVG